MSNKTKKTLFKLSGLLLAGYLMFGGEYNVYELIMLKHKADSLSQAIRQLEDVTSQLRGEINRLKTDRGYLERIARERYNMGKPGETIFVVSHGK